MQANISRSFFADSSIHACLFRSLLLRLLSFDFSLCIFLAQAGQYFDMPERGTYSTPHTVQFLGFNAVHRFVGVICNSPTKPMNLLINFASYEQIDNCPKKGHKKIPPNLKTNSEGNLGYNKITHPNIVFFIW
ncbi:hypothetical protein [Bifidobacterium breve]|uniref:hypothetical protein n=1 Tax=Bifidobacterium breve TaxID=1685 RepID=UPI001E3E49A3|nr:hypothetical protein [Bifidobacterium breve]